MEYIGFVFGIFGLMAYLQVSSLKGRIDDLERELTSIKGTSYHEDRSALIRVTREYIGQNVKIDLKEEHEDFDIMNYGNTKHGSITILDSDEQWILIEIKTPKGDKKKLIRMESIENISRITE